MIVDVHTHIWDSPEQMGQGTARRLAGVDPYKRLDASAKAYDVAMATVDKAIVLGFHSRYLGASINHEQIASHVQRNPKKYIGFAGIDPMERDFLGSLDRAQDLGLSGVLISPAAQAFHPSHTDAMLLYEACQERGLPIMIHSGTHLDTAAMMEYSQPQLLDEIGRTFPELRLVLAQVGHPWAEQALWLVGKHTHFYADLSDLTQRPWQLYNVLLLAHQQSVTNHLLLGSDFPFCTPESAIKTIFSVNQHTQGTHLPTIAREELRCIVERNALVALGLTDGDEQRHEPQPDDANQESADIEAA